MFLLKMINNSSWIFKPCAAFGCKLLINGPTRVTRKIHISHQHGETFLSGVSLKGKQIKIAQHYFEEPVLQPRSATSGRREADLTGLKVWSSAIPLLQYVADVLIPMLLKSDDLTAKSVAEIKVLELGSGTGVLGIGIASLGCNVVLTDPALDMNLTEDVSSNTFEHLRKNLEQNKSITGDRAVIEKLLWGNMEHINYIRDKYKNFDLIIGSDVLYDPKNYQNLLSTILQISEKKTTVVTFGGTKRHLEKQFLELATPFYNTSTQDLESNNKYVIHITRR